MFYFSAGWNDNTTAYTLRYTINQQVYVLFAIATGESLLINLLVSWLTMTKQFLRKKNYRTEKHSKPQVSSSMFTRSSSHRPVQLLPTFWTIAMLSSSGSMRKLLSQFWNKRKTRKRKRQPAKSPTRCSFDKLFLLTIIVTMITILISREIHWEMWVEET